MTGDSINLNIITKLEIEICIYSFVFYNFILYLVSAILFFMLFLKKLKIYILNTGIFFFNMSIQF